MPRPQPKGWGRGGRCRRLQAVVESAPTDGERTCGWPTDASPHGMQYDLHTMDYDAIVVGAGPAGSTLPRVLAWTPFWPTRRRLPASSFTTASPCEAWKRAAVGSPCGRRRAPTPAGPWPAPTASTASG